MGRIIPIRGWSAKLSALYEAKCVGRAVAGDVVMDLLEVSASF